MFLNLISYFCSGVETVGGSVGPASALVSSLGASAPSFGASPSFGGVPSFGASSPFFGGVAFFGSSFFGAGVVTGEALIGIFSSSYHSWQNSTSSKHAIL